MPEEKAVAAQGAAFGEKMIELKIRFWTDYIAPTAGKALPKHA